ncbi:type I methionyl aminopeptidase [Parapedobacter lycopersici]|uniref:type I methionyl aminopeptidase n=1 Tax=Parapedobacter lycopersici TaxID=1864939 RepID=UPI00214D14D5|nr:type I methionyl aminopeptidase [Parapedobacter lycopersici]
MSISKTAELKALKRVSDVVALTLREMREYARPGMTTKQLDDFGGELLSRFGAKSAPVITYGFPGWTCISVNQEVAHGIPSEKTVLQEGDLVNIDVSAMLNGYWADNGGSFVLGRDIHQHQQLVDASKQILQQAIHQIRGGVRIGDIGHLIETKAKKNGYTVIKNLCGHGVGKGLHEEPDHICNYRDPYDTRRFRKNTVIALETFISTKSTFAVESPDGWTLVGNRGGYVAQHEHTIVITDGVPLILTEKNEIWN